MNSKTFIILTVITVVIVITASMLIKEQLPPSQKGELLFPELMTNIADVTEIEIISAGEVITITSNDKQWQMLEKQLYPVATDKVNNLLLDMANLNILEAKTDNSNNYSKIGVEDPKGDDAKSKLVTLKKGDVAIASLIVGNQQQAKIDSTRSEIYVRKSDDKQSWLTIGQLSIENQPADWLNQQIVDIDGDNMRQIKITQFDEAEILIFKQATDDEEFQLANLAENTKVKLPYILDNISTTLSRLDFDDVMANQEFNSDITAVFTTFDGLEVTMNIMENEAKYFAQFSADFNAEMLIETANIEEDNAAESLELTVYAKAMAEKINAKVSGWTYELAQYKVDNLNKNRAELIMAIEATAPEELPSFDIDKLASPFGTPSTVD